MAPCLAKSLTQAPSRPTTSAILPVAAPAMVCSLVEANGPDSSLTLMPGLAFSKSSIIVRRAPAGSSGSHHCENSRVTSPPPPAAPLAPPEPLPDPLLHAATSATVVPSTHRAVSRRLRAPLLIELPSEKVRRRQGSSAEHLRDFAAFCNLGRVR